MKNDILRRFLALVLVTATAFFVVSNLTQVVKVSAQEENTLPESTASVTVETVVVTGNAVGGNEKFVANLQSGDQVLIDQISGQVNFDTWDNVSVCPYVVNADGLSRAVYEDGANQYVCYNNNPPIPDPLTNAGNGHAGLLMKRNNARAFVGLDGESFTANANEAFSLGINDMSASNNTGSFNVRVTITRAGASSIVTIPGNAVGGNEKFVANLQPGDRVVIDQISGQMNFDTFDTVSTCVYVVNANGLNRAVYEDPTNQFLCYNANPQTPDPMTNAGHGHAGLLLKRNGARKFVGASGASFTADANEAFSLGINDMSASNNTGSFSARVTITRAAPPNTVTIPGDAVLNNELLIANLLPGDNVVISNISGTVNFDTTDNTNDCIYTTNANGLWREIWEDQVNQLLCYTSMPIIPDPLLGPSHGHGGLYMKRGNTRTFIGKTGTSFTATTAQSFSLGINDASGSNNSGEFHADVTISRTAGSLQFSAPTYNKTENGTSATISVVRTGGSAGDVTVQYATSNGTATAGQDYTATSGVLTFVGGDVLEAFVIPIIDNGTNEPAETVNIALSNPTNGATLGTPSTAVLSIADDDSLPLILLDDFGVGVPEGNSGANGTWQFVVHLSAASAQTVTVNYATQDETATAPADYVVTSGQVVFNPGETTKHVFVPVVKETLIEDNETFRLNFSAPQNAILSRPNALGTITNDDAPGYLQFNSINYTATENAGVVTLTVFRGGGASGIISAEYSATNISATAPQDYNRADGLITFADGESNTKTFTINIINDALDEANEIFAVSLDNPTNGASLNYPSDTIVTITDNDPLPSLSIGDASIVEGNSGTSNLIFTVNLSSASGQNLTVNYATANGTAQSGADYQATSGMLSFAPGQTSRTISVPVIGETAVEPNETFLINLSGAVNAVITDNQAVGTIINNDSTPSCNYSVSPASQTIPADGGIGSFAIGTQTGCTWTLPSFPSWITVITHPTNTGSQTINFQVAANQFNLPRTATVTVAGVSISITQNPATAPGSAFDFDGDGKSDLSIFRPSNGQWWLNQSSNGITKAYRFGVSTDKIVPADYDGDGITDTAIFRPSTGEWFVLRSSNLTYYSAPFGVSTDIPAPGDFDGDGSADLTVFRPFNGVWYQNRSSDGVTLVQFGQNGDTPQVGDYDADGKSDTAIFRPSNGQWWLNRSSAGVIAARFGISSDKPVAADYTGDGKADIAFWRPSTGEWFVLRSEDYSYYAAPFGISSDIPVAGDYDGDGKFDFAVFRPSGANWYIQRSRQGLLIQQFGANGDIPVASAYVR